MTIFKFRVDITLTSLIIIQRLVARVKELQDSARFARKDVKMAEQCTQFRLKVSPADIRRLH